MKTNTWKVKKFPDAPNTDRTRLLNSRQNMSNAQKAFDGTEFHFQFGMWPKIKADKSVVLRGSREGSSYAILDDKEGIQDEGQFSGEETRVVSVKEGQTLRVTYCHVRFQGENIG